MLYAGAVTAVLAFVLEKLFGWRISEAKERKGVDLVDQGERAYDFSSIAQSHDGAVVAVADDDANKTQMAVLTSVDIDMGENEVEQSDFMVNQSEANPEQGDSEVDSKSEVEQKESSSEEEFETVKKDESSQKNKKTEKRNNSAKE